MKKKKRRKEKTNEQRLDVKAGKIELTQLLIAVSM